MVNAQTWLQEKFPTLESRETIKHLIVRNGGGRPMDINVPEEEVVRNINLDGEMDLNDFSNLEILVLSSGIGQDIK